MMTPPLYSSTGCTWWLDVPHTTLAPASTIARPNFCRRAASQPQGFVPGQPPSELFQSHWAMVCGVIQSQLQPPERKSGHVTPEELLEWLAGPATYSAGRPRQVRPALPRP